MSAYKVWTGPLGWLEGEEEPVFEAERDGTVTVSHLPRRMVIAEQLLRTAPPTLLQQKGRTFTVTADNLSGTYRLARMWGDRYDRVFGAIRLPQASAA